jgi:hypothetical protein
MRQFSTIRTTGRLNNLPDKHVRVCTIYLQFRTFEYLIPVKYVYYAVVKVRYHGNSFKYKAHMDTMLQSGVVYKGWDN